MKEFEWHQEALHSWLLNDCKGTVDATTGSGKTSLSIKAIKSVNSNSVIISVPTTHLQKQWKRELLEHFTKEEVGLVGDSHHDFSKRITVGVANSLWKVTLKKDFLIIDESHHGASKKNLEFLKRGIFNKILAISATPERIDNAHLELYKFAPKIFEYKQKEAIEDNVLCQYDIINKGVELLSNENIVERDCQYFIDNIFPLYDRDYNKVQKCMMQGDKQALDLIRAFNKRKKILLNAENKIIEAVNILKSEIISRNEFPKTIVFCEYIDIILKLEKLLKEQNIGCVVYHSKQKKKEREIMLEKFRNDEVMVMLSAKCLDEGINLPTCNLCIIISGNSTQRQMIQRSGRVLRFQEGKKAVLYQIFVKGTKDEYWMKQRSDEINKVANSVNYI